MQALKYFRNHKSPERVSNADALMDRVGVASLRGRPYTEISGGERQLVLIARALAHTGGRRIEAAQALGIGRNTITRKIAELGIEGGKEHTGE